MAIRGALHELETRQITADIPDTSGMYSALDEGQQQHERIASDMSAGVAQSAQRRTSTGPRNGSPSLGPAEFAINERTGEVALPNGEVIKATPAVMVQLATLQSDDGTPLRTINPETMEQLRQRGFRDWTQERIKQKVDATPTDSAFWSSLITGAKSTLGLMAASADSMFGNDDPSNSWSNAQRTQADEMSLGQYKASTQHWFQSWDAFATELGTGLGNVAGTIIGAVPLVAAGAAAGGAGGGGIGAIPAGVTTGAMAVSGAAAGFGEGATGFYEEAFEAMSKMDPATLEAESPLYREIVAENPGITYEEAIREVAIRGARAGGATSGALGAVEAMVGGKLAGNFLTKIGVTRMLRGKGLTSEAGAAIGRAAAREPAERTLGGAAARVAGASAAGGAAAAATEMAQSAGAGAVGSAVTGVGSTDFVGRLDPAEGIAAAQMGMIFGALGSGRQSQNQISDAAADAIEAGMKGTGLADALGDPDAPTRQVAQDPLPDGVAAGWSRPDIDAGALEAPAVERRGGVLSPEDMQARGREQAQNAPETSGVPAEQIPQVLAQLENVLEQRYGADWENNIEQISQTPGGRQLIGQLIGLERELAQTPVTAQQRREAAARAGDPNAPELPGGYDPRPRLQLEPNPAGESTLAAPAEQEQGQDGGRFDSDAQAELPGVLPYGPNDTREFRLTPNAADPSPAAQSAQEPAAPVDTATGDMFADQLGPQQAPPRPLSLSERRAAQQLALEERRQQSEANPAALPASPVAQVEADLQAAQQEVTDLQAAIAQRPPRDPRRRALREALASAKAKVAQLEDAWQQAKESAAPLLSQRTVRDEAPAPAPAQNTTPDEGQQVDQLTTALADLEGEIYDLQERLAEAPARSPQRKSINAALREAKARHRELTDQWVAASEARGPRRVGTPEPAEAPTERMPDGRPVGVQPDPVVNDEPMSPAEAQQRAQTQMQRNGRVTAATATQQAAAPAAAAAASEAGVSRTTREPDADIQQQIADMVNPKTGRDAVFAAEGTRLPAVMPKGKKIHVVSRKGVGTLLTTNEAKAKKFKVGRINDTVIGQLLGYSESKADVMAAGTEPVVVQAKKGGKVAAEQLASQKGVPAAKRAVKKLAGKGAAVTTTTPQEMQANRAAPKSLKKAAPAAQQPAAAREPAPKSLKKAARKPKADEERTPAAAEPVTAADPTPAQREAGNYSKRRVKVDGLDIAIETEAGQSRNPAWPALKNAYGYIRRSVAADNDHVDVFLGPNLEDFHTVYVVDQTIGGKFDEHKVMLGFASEVDARRAYLANYAKGWDGLGAVTPIAREDFGAWVRREALTTEPANEAVPVTAAEAAMVRYEDVVAAKLPDPVTVPAKGSATTGNGLLRTVSVDYEAAAKNEDAMSYAGGAWRKGDLSQQAKVEAGAERRAEFKKVEDALDAAVEKATTRLMADPEAQRMLGEQAARREKEGKAASNASPLITVPLTTAEVKGYMQTLRDVAKAEAATNPSQAQSVLRFMMAPFAPGGQPVVADQRLARAVANMTDAQLQAHAAAAGMDLRDHPVAKRVMRGPSEVAHATQRATRALTQGGKADSAKEAARTKTAPAEILAESAKSAKVTPRTTEHGTLPAEAVGLVESWIQQFEAGGHKFSLPVHITDMDTARRMYPDRLLESAKGGRFLRIADEDGKPTAYVLAVDWGSYQTPQAAIEALAHEYGHLVTVELYNRASPETRRAIDGAYRTWLEGQRGRSLNDVLRDQLPGYERQLAMAGGTAAFDGTGGHYASNFWEWSARNAALYVLDPKRPHLSTVEKFFAKVGAVIRKFYASLTGAPQTDRTWAEAMDRWIDGTATVVPSTARGEMLQNHDLYGDPDAPVSEPGGADTLRQRKVAKDNRASAAALSDLTEMLKGPDVEAANRTARELANDMYDGARQSKVRDVLSNVGLSLTTVRQLVRRWENTAMEQPLRNWQRNVQLRSTTARASMEAGSRVMARAHKLDSRVRAALERVMYLATTNGIHPDLEWNHTSNKHLSAGSDRATAINEQRYRQVRAIYDAMVAADPDAAKIYEDLRDEFGNMHKATLDAMESNLEYMQISKEAKAEALDRINAARATALQGGPYFPLMRYGKWIVKAKIPHRLIGKDDVAGFATEAEAKAEAARQRETNKGGVARVERDKESGEWFVRLSQDALYFFESERAARAAGPEIEREIRERYEGFDVAFDDVAKALEGTDPVISEPFISRDDRTANNAVPRKLMAELQQLEKDGKVDPTVVASFERMAIEALPEHSYRHALLPRQNILGASKHMLRSYAHRFQGAAHHHATVRYGRQINLAWEEAHKVARASEPRAGATLNMLAAAQKAAADRTRPTTGNTIANFITDASSLFSLGFSPAYALTNALQPTMVSMPVLAGMVNLNTGEAVGIAKAGKYLREAYKGAIPEFTKRGLADFITETQSLLGERSEQPTMEETAMGLINRFSKTEDEKAMLTALLRRGTLDFSWLNSLEDAMRGGAVGQKWANVQRMAMAFPQQIETMNRVVTALAAHRLARAENLVPTGDVVGLQDFADNVVADTQLDYSRTNRPLLFNQPVLSVLLQFKLYMQGMYALFARAGAQALAGKWNTPQAPDETVAEWEARIARDRKQGRRTFAYMMATHGAAGGLTATGLLGTAAKGGLVLFAAMTPDEEDDWKTGEQLQKEFFRDMFGETAGRVADRGLMTLLGVDMADRIGIPQLLDTRFMNMSERDSAATGFDKVFLYSMGAPYANMRRVWQGANGVVSGNPDDIVAGLPTALRNVVRAGRWTADGVLERDGDVFIARDQLGWSDLGMSFLGLSPVKTTEAYFDRNEEKGTKARILNRREELLRGSNRGKVTAADVDAFNRSVPAEFRISRQQLLQSRRSKAERDAGQTDKQTAAIRAMLGQ